MQTLCIACVTYSQSTACFAQSHNLALMLHHPKIGYRTGILHLFGNFFVCNKNTCPELIQDGGQVSYTASSEGQPIAVSLIGVQHAQLNGQRSVVVSDDGEWQSFFS